MLLLSLLLLPWPRSPARGTAGTAASTACSTSRSCWRGGRISRRKMWMREPSRGSTGKCSRRARWRSEVNVPLPSLLCIRCTRLLFLSYWHCPRLSTPSYPNLNCIPVGYVCLCHAGKAGAAQGPHQSPTQQDPAVSIVRQPPPGAGCAA
jgi:hypothetical protein